MDLKELGEKLLELFYDDSTDVNQENINNLVLYIEAIKNQEYTEHIIDILDNRYKEKNIYVDFSGAKNPFVFFSKWSKDGEGRIDVNFIKLPINLLNNSKPPLFIDEEKYLDIDEVEDNDWPNKYILFDEKLFNKFINPHNNSEFLNWKKNPFDQK